MVRLTLPIPRENNTGEFHNPSPADDDLSEWSVTATRNNKSDTVLK